ncbi:hypothetical protein L7F22_031581 [Adiantum nelumboides]|nr:hypothetical protein [Adiantum nelumboides]
MLHDDSLEFEKICKIEGVLLDVTKAMVEVDALRKKPEEIFDERKQEGAIENGMNVATELSAAIVESAQAQQLDANGAKLQNAHDVDEWLTWKMADDGKNLQPWKLHKLEPDRKENNAVVVEQDDIVYSEQQEELSDMLEVGDKLEVLKSPTNIDNEDYYIVLCKEAKRVLSKQVKDGWGNVLNIGDAVVHGIYYAK